MLPAVSFLGYQLQHVSARNCGRSLREAGARAQPGSTVRAPGLIHHHAEAPVDRVSADAASIVQVTMDRVWQAAGHRRSDVHASELA